MSLKKMNDFSFKFSDASGNSLNTTPQDTKAKLDLQAGEVRSFINNTLIPEIDTELATKEELNDVIAGQINTIDPVTNKKYAIIIENGILGVKEVG